MKKLILLLSLAMLVSSCSNNFERRKNSEAVFDEVVYDLKSDKIKEYAYNVYDSILTEKAKVDGEQIASSTTISSQYKLVDKIIETLNEEDSSLKIVVSEDLRMQVDNFREVFTSKSIAKVQYIISKGKLYYKVNGDIPTKGWYEPKGNNNSFQSWNTLKDYDLTQKIKISHNIDDSKIKPYAVKVFSDMESFEDVVSAFCYIENFDCYSISGDNFTMYKDGYPFLYIKGKKVMKFNSTPITERR